jgi:hypothetical protein
MQSTIAAVACSPASASTTVLTFDAIKQHLIQHGAHDLLDLLPTCDRMRWGVTADLQPALVIGGSDTQDILASTKPTDDGRFEIRAKFFVYGSVSAVAKLCFNR